MNHDLKIARMRREEVAIQAMKDTALVILDNPVVDYIGALWAMKQLDKHYPNFDTALNQGLVATICTAKALAGALASPGAAALVTKFLK